MPCPLRPTGGLLARHSCTNPPVALPPYTHTFGKCSAGTVLFWVYRWFPVGITSEKITHVTDILARGLILCFRDQRLDCGISAQEHLCPGDSAPPKLWSPQTAPLPSRRPQTQIPGPKPEQENGGSWRSRCSLPPNRNSTQTTTP